MIRPVVHMVLHFAVPAAVAKWGFSQHWRRAWLIMMATMLVDLDHLLADPIYAPDRCSIGTHLLHTPLPIAFYTVLCFIPKTRLVGIGLIIHMILDGMDCWLMSQ